jgi:hypothetical protein
MASLVSPKEGIEFEKLPWNLQCTMPLSQTLASGQHLRRLTIIYYSIIIVKIQNPVLKATRNTLHCCQDGVPGSS